MGQVVPGIDAGVEFLGEGREGAGEGEGREVGVCGVGGGGVGFEGGLRGREAPGEGEVGEVGVVGEH